MSSESEKSDVWPPDLGGLAEIEAMLLFKLLRCIRITGVVVVEANDETDDEDEDEVEPREMDGELSCWVDTTRVEVGSPELLVVAVVVGGEGVLLGELK